MGVSIEYNWILKLNEMNENIAVNSEYKFVKNEMRIYPIGVPIQLVNKNWVPVALCVIKSITITEETTSGTYKIIKILNENEKNMMAREWKEYNEYLIDSTNIQH